MSLSQLEKALKNVKALGKNGFYFDSLDSTSTYLRNRFTALPHGTFAVAKEQLSGRGRSGKTFYSPKGEGLYVSFILKEEPFISDPLLTVKLSYALCKAVERITDSEKVRIKWVNDLYFEKKKLAGILCERIVKDGEQGVIVGIGVNLSLNKGEIPPELRGKIGCLKDVARKHYDADVLCAALFEEVEALYDGTFSDKAFLQAYKARSNVLGKEIYVLKNGEPLHAAALEIAPDAGLVVRYEDGITEKLTAGEISILPFA